MASGMRPRLLPEDSHGGRSSGLAGRGADRPRRGRVPIRVVGPLTLVPTLPFGSAALPRPAPALPLGAAFRGTGAGPEDFVAVRRDGGKLAEPDTGVGGVPSGRLVAASSTASSSASDAVVSTWRISPSASMPSRLESTEEAGRQQPQGVKRKKKLARNATDVEKGKKKVVEHRSSRSNIRP